MNKRAIIQLLSQIFMVLGLFSGCSGVFYQPTHFMYVPPHLVDLKPEDIKFTSQDGTPLHGWHFPSHLKQSETESFTVFFHGNAQNLTAHYLNLKWMPEKGHAFFIFDYRGYGISGFVPKIYGEGERPLHPNQHGVYLDALAALEKGYELYKKSKAKKFIVYGQSLGGIILMRALEDFKYREEVSLVILDSTFHSYQKIARSKVSGSWLLWPLTPLTYILVSDEFAPRKFFTLNKTKTLVIHGKKDHIIPYSFGEEIFSKLQVKEKWFWELPEGKHIDVFINQYKANRDKLDRLIRDKI